MARFGHKVNVLIILGAVGSSEPIEWLLSDCVTAPVSSPIVPTWQRALLPHRAGERAEAARLDNFHD